MQKRTSTQFLLGKSETPASLAGMANSATALRRWLGLFCLALASGLLIWGQTILKPILTDGWFVLYWGICFLFTFSAIVIALIDLWMVRRSTREEQSALLEKTLEEIRQEATQPDDEARG